MEFNLKLPATEDEIATETKRLFAEVRVRKVEIDMLYAAIAHYQRQCKHPGQITGSNERDGSWGNPCPVCGYSY